MVWDRKVVVCLKDDSLKKPPCMISKVNQVKFARFVLLAVNEKQKHDFIFFCSMYNRIYNKILDRDWFSTHLFVT